MAENRIADPAQPNALVTDPATNGGPPAPVAAPSVTPPAAPEAPPVFLSVPQIVEILAKGARTVIVATATRDSKGQMGLGVISFSGTKTEALALAEAVKGYVGAVAPAQAGI